MPSVQRIAKAKEMLIAFAKSEAGTHLAMQLTGSGKYIAVIHLDEGIYGEIGFFDQGGWGYTYQVPDPFFEGQPGHTLRGGEALDMLAKKVAGLLAGRWTSLEDLQTWLEDSTAEQNGTSHGVNPE